jgi:hypothetical protein
MKIVTENDINVGRPLNSVHTGVTILFPGADAIKNIQSHSEIQALNRFLLFSYLSKM